MRTEKAVQRAVQAVRRFERQGYGRENAVEALEAALGPLDWSRGGEGFRLLRRVAEQAFGSDYGRNRISETRREEQARDLRFYDAYRSVRIRLDRSYRSRL